MEAIINFFKNLFGGASTADGVADEATDSAHDEDAHRRELSKHIKGLEHVEGAENIRISYGKILRECKGAALVEDPDDGEKRWSDTWSRERPKEQWTDEWGPVAAKDIDSFWHHKTEFDMLQAGDPEEAEQKLQSLGYRDVGHFFQVQHTFLKYFGEPQSPGTMLDDMIWDQGIVSKAAMAGAMRYQAGLHQQALSSNPELLSPVDGVDVDTYAELASKAGAGMGQADFLALLGKKGLDLARWEKVNATWTDRMSKDTSGAIAMAYSKAFGAAGAGKYGAAGQAGAAVLGSGTVTAAAGAEPISFDRYCEIQGAMSAWSATGQDVNAMLKHTFDITAVDWSTLSMWWMSKMQSELSLFTKHSELTTKYEQQYKEAAGMAGGADDDLSF